MTTRYQNLSVPFTFRFNVTASGTPEQLSAKLRDTTIAFVEGVGSPDTITDSSSRFITSGFQPGDQLTVSGSALNDGTYVIASVTAGTITLLAREDLTTEGAAATVLLKAPKSVPDGIGIVIKSYYANGGNICVGYSSATALNTGIGNFRLRNNESITLHINNVSNVWLDATVSGEGVEVLFEKNIQE